MKKSFFIAMVMVLAALPVFADDVPLNLGGDDSDARVIMRDTFDKSVASLDGKTPDHGRATWSIHTDPGGNVASSDGTQAIVSTGGGTPGKGGLMLWYPFEVEANTIYTLTATFVFNGTSKADCWAGLGFYHGDPDDRSNVFEFMRPVGTSGDDFQWESLNSGLRNVDKGTMPGSAGPNVTFKLVYNSKTQEIAYFFNDISASKATVTLQFDRIYLNFYQTGNLVNARNVSLTSKPAP